jgi:hypothetical protein
LERDSGRAGVFFAITNYGPGFLSAYVLDVVDFPTLVSGVVYRFRIKSSNSIGDSGYSELTSAALARLPS